VRAPTLTDGQDPDRITLRPHESRDVDDVLAMCRDEDMQHWTTVPVPYERHHAESFVAARAGEWERDGDCTLAIEAVDDDGMPRLAGNVALRPNGSGAADIGYALAPWARGRGVMSRAVRLALEWGFTATSDGGAGLTVVHWEAHVGNWASRRVAWACGFRVEGLVRGLCEQRGEVHDAWIGSIVRGEPLSPATRWLEVPRITGDGVVLREWRPDDAARVVEACSDPLSQHWLPQLPSPYTTADAQWYIRSREEAHATGAGIYWCVADADDDRCLASIGLMRLDGPTAEPEIGYWAHPEARGRGVVTQATALVARHALVDVADGGLGLSRVVLRAASGNTASNRVAVAAGLRQYGVAHEMERLRDGTSDDFVLYEALARDWPAQAVG
jgi:RimJ/RimL family protein N-acetyltransferase